MVSRLLVGAISLSVVQHPCHLQSCYHLRCAGAYALQEITAILDPKLAADKMGRDIMDKLQSYSKKAPTKCNGLKMDIQINPMSPTKSIMWRRSSVAESGADMSSSDFEDVPYVMLYFTVSHTLFVNHEDLLHKKSRLQLMAIFVSTFLIVPVNYAAPAHCSLTV